MALHSVVHVYPPFLLLYGTTYFSKVSRFKVLVAERVGAISKAK